MSRIFFTTLPILLATSLLASCSNGDQPTEKKAEIGVEKVDSMVPTRHCYRNEYPFDYEPDQRDVQSLIIRINGDHAVGEYNWLPAFKDKRVGRFEGSFDGQVVRAKYRYTQEGQSAVSSITIRIEPDQVVVEGGGPELGLNATIARVDC